MTETLQRILEATAWEALTFDYDDTSPTAYPKARIDIAVLERRLLPILLAGQAMRNEMAIDPDCSASDNGFIRKWDAALEQAAKGDK